MLIYKYKKGEKYGGFCGVRQPSKMGVFYSFFFQLGRGGVSNVSVNDYIRVAYKFSQ